MSQTPYVSPMGGPGTPSGRVRLEVIGEAWNYYSKNFVPWILAGLIYLFVVGAIFFICYGLIFAILGTMLESAGGLAIFLTSGMIMAGFAIAMAAGAVIMGGATRMALNEIRGIKAEVGMVFSETGRIGDLIIAQLIIGIVGTFGMMCCYIPGFIWYGLTLLTVPLIIDRKMSALDAIKTSIETMKSQLGMATITYVVLSIIAGFCSILTLPLYFLGVTGVYKDMIGLADGGPVAAPMAPAAPVTEAPAAPAAPEAPAEPAAPVEPEAPADPAPPTDEAPPSDEPNP
ncbi:MAG: hypothetical protein KF784_06530 [Fimbriimonadaceae bacterium]|nr:hypothetical protein [Fimbriimonadaceae bacterium]